MQTTNSFFTLKSIYYEFSAYNGEVIRYPVAAYAARFSDRWIKVSPIYEWLDKQSQPIAYEAVLALAIVLNLHWLITKSLI